MAQFLGFCTVFFAILGGGILLIVNLMLGVGVLRDGDRLRATGRDTSFGPPIAWFLSVLVGSFVAVALYWLIHHSNLRAPETKSSAGQ